MALARVRHARGRARRLGYDPRMLALDEARALLATLVTPLRAVTLPLANAWGHRLAHAPLADVDLPPGDVAAMDGYAVRASETAAGRELPVALVAAAGSAPQTLPPGSAARILTGAVLPHGADTVVAQEDAELTAGGTVILGMQAAAINVRRRGEIFSVGTRLANEGDLLAAQRVGVLAAGGADPVCVFPRPRLAFVVTGEELVEPGSTPLPGQIRNSNGPMLGALAHESALPVTSRGQAGDTLAAIRSSIEHAASCADLVLTSGGVSVGDFDLVPQAVVELGGELVLHGVCMRPGKPVLVARIGGAWLVGLPGNPGAVLTCWRLFARPLAEALAGDRAAFAETPIPAAIAAAVRNRSGRTLLRPAVLAPAADRLAVTVASWHGSHDVAASSGANALARLEAGAELLAGAVVPCYPLPWKWVG
jgi:molybdopterin molybdotransferase